MVNRSGTLAVGDKGNPDSGSYLRHKLPGGTGEELNHSTVSRASTAYYEVDTLNPSVDNYLQILEKEAGALSSSGSVYVDANSLSFGSLSHFRATLQSIKDEKFKLEEFQGLRETIGTRQSIRILAAEVRSPFPYELDMSSIMWVGRKRVAVQLGRDYLTWTKPHQTRYLLGEILTDDIISAVQDPREPCKFRILCYHRGKGRGQKVLNRKPKWYPFRAQDAALSELWVKRVKLLVKWQARVPLQEKRKILVVVNPHSGKRRGRKVYEREVKPLLDLCDIVHDVQETSYSGHAIDMGKAYNPHSGYESFLFVSGDGTIFEFLNGLLSRPKEEWSEILDKTYFSLVSAGTQNGFAVGVGIPTPHAAMYSLIKRKQRPVDMLAVTNQLGGKVHYAISAVAWGLPGDVAQESESHRWLGTLRYGYLSVKWFLINREHRAVIKYVPVRPQPVLRSYFDIRDDNAIADDQYDAEEGSVYGGTRGSSFAEGDGSPMGDGELSEKVKQREALMKEREAALKDPADVERYPPEQWCSEEGSYAAIACLDTVPDGKYTNPSDGMMDLILARKGGLIASLHQGILYLLGKEDKSPLYDYIKVKAIMLQPKDPKDALNIDGEVLPGPGPFRAEIVPRMIKVLSEK